MGTRTELIWLTIGQVAGTCECGNEPMDYLKCGEFFLSSWKPVSLSRRTLLHGVGNEVADMDTVTDGHDFLHAFIPCCM